jgi:hypothetical protein
MCVNIGGIWLSIYLVTGKAGWLAFSDFWIGRGRKLGGIRHWIWRQVGFGMGDDA